MSLSKEISALRERFTKSMQSYDFPKNTLFAIACSGGPDSMALALLAKEWATHFGHRLIALTVDHGLRTESADEAKQVSRWLKTHAIHHSILTWKGAKPTRNIQEEARILRYRLLADYCAQHSITTLLTGHTLEDQAETFLLRLARGSGVDGLSAMAERKSFYGVMLLRPLLDTSKTELVAYLDSLKQPYIRDPSNENIQFDRVKIRKLFPQLAAAGLTPQRLASTARTMQRARVFLEAQTHHFLRQHCWIYNEGYALLKRMPDHEEIALRVLAELLLSIGGHAQRPRLSELERLHTALLQPGFKGASLGGCEFSTHRDEILIIREMKAVEAPVRLMREGKTLWDKRFFITTEASSRRSFSVGALTQKHWLELARCHKMCNPYPSKKILYTLPAIYDEKGALLSVPHLGFPNLPKSDFTAIFWQPLDSGNVTE